MKNSTQTLEEISKRWIKYADPQKIKDRWRSKFSRDITDKSKKAKEGAEGKRFEDNLVWEVLIRIVRQKTPEWRFNKPNTDNESFSKYQLESELRAVAGVTILRTIPGSVREIANNLESSIYSLRYEPHNVAPMRFFQKVIQPEIEKIPGIQTLMILQEPKAFKANVQEE